MEHMHKSAKSPTSKGSLEMLHETVDNKEKTEAALELIDKYPREQGVNALHHTPLQDRFSEEK